MTKPKRPTDLYVVNGWWIELPGLVSPHFETLEGVKVNSDTVKIVDAGSNTTYSFNNQIVDYGDMTLTRTRQGTADDATLAALVFACIKKGLKMNARVVKTHNGVEVFSLLMEGFRFVNKSYPTFDVNSGDKFMESFSATCDEVIEL